MSLGAADRPDFRTLEPRLRPWLLDPSAKSIRGGLFRRWGVRGEARGSRHASQPKQVAHTARGLAPPAPLLTVSSGPC